MELNAKAFGVAGGIVWGVSLFLLGIVGMLGFKAELITLFSSAYLGFGATPVGSIIGLVYGFIEGFIGCFIFAWLYNCVINNCPCCNPGKKKKK